MFGNLDAHEAELKELVNEFLLEDALLVHFLGEGTNTLLGELPDVVAKQDFVFGERGQGGGVSDGSNSLRHTNTFKSRMANLRF